MKNNLIASGFILVMVKVITLTIKSVWIQNSEECPHINLIKEIKK